MSKLVRERDEPRLEDGVPVVRVARDPEDRQMRWNPYGEVAPLVSGAIAGTFPGGGGAGSPKTLSNNHAPRRIG